LIPPTSCFSFLHLAVIVLTPNENPNLMKAFKLAICVLTLVFGTQLFAQQTLGINYQGILRDDIGTLLINEAITVDVEIHEEGQSPDYEETHSLATNENGLLQFVIGTGSTSDVFSDLTWTGSAYYYTLYITGDFGSVSFDPEPFNAVPYALSSGNSYWNKSNETIFTLGNKVGIGTNNMVGAASLIVKNTTPDQWSGMYVASDGTGIGEKPFYGYSTSEGVRAYHYFDETENSFNLFMSDAPAGANAMVVSEEGYLGLGIDSPEAKLHVKGEPTNTDDPLVVIHNQQSGDAPTALHAQCASNLGTGSAGNFLGGKIGISTTGAGGLSEESVYGLKASATSGFGRHGTRYGIHTTATGGNVNIGIYAEAGNGLNDWAGIFSGAVDVQGLAFLSGDVQLGNWISDDVTLYGTMKVNFDTKIIPSTDHFAEVGSGTQAFGSMWSYGYYTPSDMNKKRDIHFLQRDDLEELMLEVEQLPLAFYRFKEENDEPIDDAMTNYQPTAHLGTMVQESPDFIKSPGQEGINLYDYISLILAGVQYNRITIKESLRTTGSQGQITTNQHETFVAFSDDFKANLSGKTPIVTLSIEGSFIQYCILSIEQDGFTIGLKDPTQDVVVNWIAQADVASNENSVAGHEQYMSEKNLVNKQ
jgi:hypothetical protein